MESKTKQFIGFSITGTLSTVFMLLIYAGLNHFIAYQWSYLVSYCLSVLALYFMNVLWVFKKTFLLSTFLKFPFIYLLQYLIGAASLEILVRFGFSITYAPVIVVIILLPLTFVLNRIVLFKTS